MKRTYTVTIELNVRADIEKDFSEVDDEAKDFLAREIIAKEFLELVRYYSANCKTDVASMAKNITDFELLK